MESSLVAEKPAIFTRGVHCLIFDTEYKTLQHKTVQKYKKKILYWKDGTTTENVSQERRLSIFSLTPEEDAILFRNWKYILAGDKYGFRFETADDTMILFGDDPEKEREDPEQSILPGILEFHFSRANYPGDPVDDQRKEFSTKVFLKKNNELLKPQSFCEVLEFLFGSHRCICPKGTKARNVHKDCPIHCD